MQSKEPSTPRPVLLVDGRTLGVMAQWGRAVSGAVLLISAAAFTARSQAAPDEAAVRAVVASITAAWNAGNAAGIARAFTPTGLLIAGDGTQHIGRAAIEAFFARLLAQLPSGTRFTAPITTLRFRRADVALLVSEGGFLWPTDTAVTSARFGVQSFLVVRDGDAWRVALVQRTRIVPVR